MTVIALCLFLTVSYVSLQCVIVAFPDHTPLLFDMKFEFNWFNIYDYQLDQNYVHCN